MSELSQTKKRKGRMKVFHGATLSSLNDDDYSFHLREREAIIGRADVCNFKIDHPFLSGLHAKLSVTRKGVIVTDLDSTNGLFVNRERVKHHLLSEGDVISLGQVELLYSEETLEKSERSEEYKTTTDKTLTSFRIPGTNKETVLAEEMVSHESNFDITEKSSTEQTALINLKQVKFSRTLNPDVYIFQDADEIYPIVGEVPKGSCLEVILMTNDSILSMDYLPLKQRKIYATGRMGVEGALFFDTLSSRTRVKVFEIQKNRKITFFPLKGHDNYLIQKGSGSEVLEPVEINQDSLIKIKRESYSINIKIVEPPRPITNPPFTGRDTTFKFFISVALILIGAIYYYSQIYEVKKPIEKVPDIKKVTRILYKKREKLPEPPKVVEKKKVDVKKVEKKVETKAASAKPKKKVVEQKKIVKKESPIKKKPVVKKSVRKVKRVAKKKVLSQQKKIKKVAAFKKFNFSNDLKAITTNKKVSMNFGMKAAETIGDTKLATGVKASDIVAAQSEGEYAKIDVGTVGKVGFSDGVSGFGGNKDTNFDDVYTQTVLKGSIDPDLIREILRRYLPQFRYCYDQEMIKKRKKLKGLMKLDFVISPSGRVTRSAIQMNNFKLSQTGSKCMRSVLHSIQFPRPKGGGIVEVKQPIYMEPNL